MRGTKGDVFWGPALQKSERKEGGVGSKPHNDQGKEAECSKTLKKAPERKIYWGRKYPVKDRKEGENRRRPM